MKKKIRVLLDLDGVLCDFGAQYLKINGKRPDDVYQPGAPRTPEKDKYWNQYVDQAGFEDAPPMPDAAELLAGVTKLMKEGLVHVVEICTSAGGKERQVDVTKQKKVWLNLHGLDDLTAHITQNGYKKADVINKDKYHDILIDDTETVLDNFKKHGGFGIHHTSSKSSVEQLEKLVHELSGN